MKQNKVARSYVKIYTEREINAALLDSYGTLKSRLMNGADFFEVTLSSGEKKTLSKSCVVEVGPIAKPAPIVDPAVTIN